MDAQEIVGPDRRSGSGTEVVTRLYVQIVRSWKRGVGVVCGLEAYARPSAGRLWIQGAGNRWRDSAGRLPSVRSSWSK